MGLQVETRFTLMFSGQCGMEYVQDGDIGTGTVLHNDHIINTE